MQHPKPNFRASIKARVRVPSLTGKSRPVRKFWRNLRNDPAAHIAYHAPNRMGKRSWLGFHIIATECIGQCCFYRTSVGIDTVESHQTIG